MEDFRKLVERKVTERREEKEKHPEKLRKWSITKTIVQENIECDVTIKVKYTECIGHVSPLHLPPSCVLFVLCFFSSRKLLPELHACITLSLSLCCINVRISISSLKNFSLQFQLNQKKFHPNANLRSVATGSWGCGSQLGDAQFKVIIQWLAASVANVPILIYYTCSNENLSKLDTVVRVLHGNSPSTIVSA